MLGSWGVKSTEQKIAERVSVHGGGTEAESGRAVAGSSQIAFGKHLRAQLSNQQIHGSGKLGYKR